jgi:membrane protein implicated in regulation of membrane protease activity
MLVLGIILLVVAAGFFVAVLFGGGGQATVDLGGLNVTMNTFAVFLLGMGTVILAVLGLWLIMAGLRRANRRRQDKKELNRLSRKLEARETPSAAETASSTGAPTAGSAQSSGGAPTTESTATSGPESPTASGPASPSPGTTGEHTATDRDQPRP